MYLEILCTALKKNRSSMKWLRNMLATNTFPNQLTLNAMLLSASGIFSCGRRYHGCVCDSERTALLVQEGDAGSTSAKHPFCCFFWFCLVTFYVCFPGWNRPRCHQWLISLGRFHLQTASQTLQGSAVLHPPTGAIYRGSIDPSCSTEHMQTLGRDP